MYIIYNAEEYDDWLKEQPPKSQLQVLERISKIREYEHFGEHKCLEDDVWELKWKNGRRVYYAYIPEKKILLLLGGNKNGQSKDVHKAKKTLHAHALFKK